MTRQPIRLPRLHRGLLTLMAKQGRLPCDEDALEVAPGEQLKMIDFLAILSAFCKQEWHFDLTFDSAVHTQSVTIIFTYLYIYYKKNISSYSYYMNPSLIWIHIIDIWTSFSFPKVSRSAGSKASRP